MALFRGHDLWKPLKESPNRTDMVTDFEFSIFVGQEFSRAECIS
jgi:hypothetical protein